MKLKKLKVKKKQDKNEEKKSRSNLKNQNMKIQIKGYNWKIIKNIQRMRNITQIFLTKEIFMNSSMLGMDFKGGERNEKKRKKIALIIKVVNFVSVGILFFQLE